MVTPTGVVEDEFWNLQLICFNDPVTRTDLRGNSLRRLKFNSRKRRRDGRDSDGLRAQFVISQFEDEGTVDAAGEGHNDRAHFL